MSAAQPRPRLRPPFPDDLVLTPVSRRPTRLEESTLRTLLERPVPGLAAPGGTPEASIVVTTRDNLPFLRLCLESVLAAADAPLELIVVDNGSSDGTAEYLARLTELNPCVRPVRNESNRGFAAANNQGAALAAADLLVLLNDDTAVTHGWLGRLATHLQAPDVGMVGPVTNRTGNEAQVDAGYRTLGELERFADERAALHAGEAFDIPTLTMFCVALQRSLYEQVGPLDERFGTGLLEDDDYSRRVRGAGRRLLCADDAFVHHFGEASFGKLLASGEYGRLLAENRARYEEKWRAPWEPYARRQSSAYRELAERMRRAVASVVPAGATVLVVSRGDDALLELPGRRARHFPGAPDGLYAGHHPADGAEAIALLESEHAAGAGYIAFPATGLWWLEHYRDLAWHLESSSTRVFDEPESCVIFDLAGGAG